MTTTQAATNRSLSELEARVVRPGDEGWDQARQAFNLTLDQRPDLVAFPADAADVARVVRFASREGLRVAPQRTGHAAGALGDLEGTILLKTNSLTKTEIDALGRTARVEAGAQWQDVVPAASDLGLAALHGSAPDIGIVGYSLSGGIGWYARKLGLATNSVTAIELVNAEGEQIRANADSEADLFWALRGGGGNFGVVTALEFRLHEVGPIYAGALFFPFERAAEVLHGWREWIATVPEEVTSIGRMMQFPPLEQIPEPFRGRSFSLVEATCLADEATGRELLRPLRELGPELDTFAIVPLAALPALHMDPPEPVPYEGEDLMLASLPPAAIDDLLAAVGPGSGSPLLSVELRHLGGALARPRSEHGALAAIDGAIVGYSVGIFGDDAAQAAVEAYLARVKRATAPYAAERRYYNFVEEDVEASTFFDAETLARLQRIRRVVDPEGIFRANHPIRAE
jgi:FAD/FMN-containing dehydrogenase